MTIPLAALMTPEKDLFNIMHIELASSLPHFFRTTVAIPTLLTPVSDCSAPLQDQPYLNLQHYEL